MEEHRECLDTLKAGIRAALRKESLASTSDKPAGDVADALLLIERTLRGQTCFFGGCVFAPDKACIVLLNLLKLLPEPPFEAVAPALISTISQLVEQRVR